MRSRNTKNQKGFTIIEVVLVLAIAGLIFLIVFLALPQLQRSRRDTQRKNDAGRLLAALENYAGNTNGDYPSNALNVQSQVVNAYLNSSDWRDPDTGAAYSLVDVTASSTSAVDIAGEIGYEQNAQCRATGITPQDALDPGAGDRSIAVVMFQESGGVYCQDNR